MQEKLTQLGQDKVVLDAQTLSNLDLVEKFYEEIGGIVGYHTKVVQLMHEKSCAHTPGDYSRAPGLNLTQDLQKTRQAELAGIANLGMVAEMYPVGGAGDRLGLPLPAACLPFCGRTLLEGLIRDLEAREYLYFKLYGKKLITPVALMTSHEKNNHEHVLKIFEDHQWFGRPRESFSFFIQPLVPVITEEGNWLLKEDKSPVMKPGGHGVIWKLAQDHHVFSWFEEQGRKKILVRQINNPIAGIDGGLLAFMGVGCVQDKAFGFLSCPRRVKSAEGVLVLNHHEANGVHSYCISNLEYTDFARYGIDDRPETPGSIYSHYPSNTNVLFVDIQAVQRALLRCAIPGLLINIRKSVGRLESTMQNIADYMDSCFTCVPERIEEVLNTYVVYNEREKTISVTKNSYGEKFWETPESAFYDILQASKQLLRDACGFFVPRDQTPEEYVAEGPNSIFIYSPVLGPLYSVIAQKVRGGCLKEGAELQIEGPDIDIEGLEVEGSLLIEGKCRLRNVVVRNKGRRKESGVGAWRNCPEREEALVIRVHGSGEFVAEDVELEGGRVIEVQDGYRVRACEGDKLREEKIEGSGWEWQYAIEGDRIVLSHAPLC